MTLFLTITDATMAANAGGPTESETFPIEIPDWDLPLPIKQYFDNRKKARTLPNFNCYQTLAISWAEPRIYLAAEVAERDKP